MARLDRRRSRATEEDLEDSSDEREEEAFLASQRQSQRKVSNPGSGKVSTQNSASETKSRKCTLPISSPQEDHHREER